MKGEFTHLKMFSDAVICDCQTVNVISNLEYVHGTYQKLGYVNGRTSWNSSTGTAVWFYPEYSGWFFGPMENIGGSSVYMIAFGLGNDSCFYNISNTQWQYYNSGVNGWAYVENGDVSIQCLSGNFQ